MSSVSHWPDRIQLVAGKSHRILITATGVDGFERDATSHSAFVSDHPAVAEVDASGMIHGVAPGVANITATFNGKTTVAAVTVNPAAGDGISFAHDLLPVLSRAGCNAGSCHAKPQGQNGFKLSVFAYDPKSDYRAIVKGDRGRRVFAADPEESLLLKKPTMAVQHGGGERFKRGSTAYNLIAKWIEQGMAYSLPGDSALVSVDAYPPERRYRKGANQALLVIAHYADGSAVDVTDLADFKSNASEIAGVNDAGVISVKDLNGQAVVTARFMGEVAVSLVTVPADRLLPDSVYAALPANNFIDHAVHARLKDIGVAPSETCSDAEFIRRASIDAIGVLPTPDEAREFLADTNPDKRAKLVARLLEKPAYADYWATKWGDLLRPNHLRVGVKPVYLFDQWIRESLRQNKPYDQFVREILTASGNTHKYGPVVVFRDRREPADATTLVSQIFMGVRLECARCHHHPNEKWSQADFYQLAAFFAQMHRKGQGISPPISGEAEFIWFAPGGEVKHPLSGEIMRPKPPDGPVLDIPPDRDPREALADWLARPDNPFFARAAVNRVWGELFGRGIVHPVDDFRASNPPSNERLLNELARDFIEHHYDVKHLIRTIMASRVYQESSLPNESNVADTRNFSRSYRRRMPAEVLCDAVADVTGTTETFDGLAGESRAVQTWNNKLESNFLDAFGRPNSSADCPCDRDRGTSVVQMLHLMNSTQLQNRIDN
ncbi:MAG TPA: DUF1549 domain-containing protein, partial [Humisphaera sp.]|nr:DUF1549 domain-containing protein [Humisphaera sp.]